MIPEFFACHIPVEIPSDRFGYDKCENSRLARVIKSKETVKQSHIADFQRSELFLSFSLL